MADTAATTEYSMTEIATHSTKESTWLVIKDMNDGGKRCDDPTSTAAAASWTHAGARARERF